MCFAANNISLMRNGNHALVCKMADLFPEVSDLRRKKYLAMEW